MRTSLVGFAGVLLAGIPTAWAGPLLFEDFLVQGEINNAVTIDGQQTLTTEEILFGLNDGARSELTLSSDGQSASAFSEAVASDDSFTLTGRSDAQGEAEALTTSGWLISFVASRSMELLFDWDIANAFISYGVSLNGEFVGEFFTSFLLQAGDAISIDVGGGAFAPSGEYSFTWTASQVAVPEPGTLALLGIGLAGIGFGRRRRHS